jgi:hypothetical protein
VFVIYDLLASFAGAAGALFAGSIGLWGALGLTGASAYKPLFVVYAAIGLLNLVLFNRLSDKVEQAKVEGERRFVGIHRSRGTVTKLSLLFSMDSFAGGLTVQSLVAYWCNLRGDNLGKLDVRLGERTRRQGEAAALGVPFFASGAIKIVYDALTYFTFKDVRPPEEEELYRAKLEHQAQSAIR